MTQPKILSVLILGLAFTVAVNTFATNSGSEFCPAQGALSLDVSPFSIDSYDVIGKFYFEETDNSQDVYIKYPDATASPPTNLKFLTFDEATGDAISNQVENSADKTFVYFSKGIVVLTNSDQSQYYFAKYQPDSQNSVFSYTSLSLPSDTGLDQPYDQFVPFYYEDVDQQLYVAIRKGTKFNIYYFSSDGTYNNYVSASRTLQAGQTVASIVGTKICFTGVTNGEITCWAQGATMLDPNIWAERASVFSIGATDTFELLPIAANHFGLLKLASSGLSGNFYTCQYSKIKAGTVRDTTNLPTATRPYQWASDQISNVVVYSDAAFVWLNLDYESSLRLATQTTNVIDTGSTLISLTLTSNKLVILHDDHVNYYRILNAAGGNGVGEIQLLYSKTFSSTAITDDGIYKFGLSCLCSALKRFTCYASTLNCVLIKKAGVACGNRDMNPQYSAPL